MEIQRSTGLDEPVAGLAGWRAGPEFSGAKFTGEERHVRQLEKIRTLESRWGADNKVNQFRREKACRDLQFESGPFEVWIDQAERRTWFLTEIVSEL